MNQVASTENLFIFCTRGGQSSDKEDRYLKRNYFLITLLHCNIYFASKCPKMSKNVSFCEKYHTDENAIINCLCNTQLHQCKKSLGSGSRCIHHSVMK